MKKANFLDKKLCVFRELESDRPRDSAKVNQYHLQTYLLLAKNKNQGKLRHLSKFLR